MFHKLRLVFILCLINFGIKNGAFCQSSSANVGAKHKWVTSYYHQKFNGRKTANGEIYSDSKFTAAHKSLPFGTMLHVTNPNNNKSVVVRINDRGPYITNRHLDLSLAAAKAIGLQKKGVLKLNVTIVGLNGIEEIIFWPEDSTTNIQELPIDSSKSDLVEYLEDE